MDLDLRGKVAFVAAASKGMGRAIAESFAEEGADVGMCARRGEALEEAAKSVRERGVRAIATPADVTNEEQVSAAVERTVSELGRLDALIVNAGGPPPGNFDDIDDAQWEAIFQLTFMSAVHLVRSALPALRRSPAASILFVESSSIREPIPGLTLSNAIRPAVAGLAKSLSRELAPAVRVNTLLPGRIRTDRQIELAQMGGATDLEHHFAAVAEGVPLGRVAEPVEFARVAVFLSSPAASYVTGTMLAVDGGLIRAV